MQHRRRRRVPGTSDEAEVLGAAALDAVAAEVEPPQPRAPAELPAPQREPLHEAVAQAQVLQPEVRDLSARSQLPAQLSGRPLGARDGQVGWGPAGRGAHRLCERQHPFICIILPSLDPPTSCARYIQAHHPCSCRSDDRRKRFKALSVGPLQPQHERYGAGEATRETTHAADELAAGQRLPTAQFDCFTRVGASLSLMLLAELLAKVPSAAEAGQDALCWPQTQQKIRRKVC